MHCRRTNSLPQPLYQHPLQAASPTVGYDISSNGFVPSDMTWSFHPALDAFHQLRDRWDALNLAQNNHILLDSGFVAALLRHFASRDVVLGINEEASNPAIALMERIAPGIWETFQPYCAPLGPILYGAGESGRENIVSLMRSRSEEHTSELQSPCNLVCRL